MRAARLARPALRRARRLAPAAVAVVSLGLAAACASRKPPAPASRPAPPSAPRPSWSEEGVASYYGGGDGFDGKPTASGETFDASQLTAAHRELPLGSIVDVTSLDTNRTVRVRINDRGPFAHGRIIDLSQAAAREIAMIGPGTARVRVVLVTEAPVVEPTSPSGLWAVQVGSFSEKPRADRHADRVRAAGYTVYFESYKGLTRVKVGPLDSRADAEAALATLEQAGFEGIVVAAGR